MKNLHINEYYKKMLEGKSLTLPQKKAWQYVYDNNKDRLDNIAIQYNDEKVTYKEMFDRWKSFANNCNELNINKDSRVLVISPNVPFVFDVFYGLNMVGATCDFIDPTSSGEVVKTYIENEKITDIICLDLLYEKNLKSVVDELKDKYNINNILLFNDKGMTNKMPLFIKGYLKVMNSKLFLNKNVKLYNQNKKVLINDKLELDKYEANKLSLITHTSGTTTGIGKPVPITDDNMNALVFQHELAELCFQPGMSMLHFIPWFAAYGSCNTAHLGLGMGMKLIEIPLFDPKDFGKLLLDYKPNIVLANTPSWLFLMKDERLKEADLSFLKLAVSGGTPTNEMDEIMLNVFFKEHGSDCILTKGHGLSEVCGCASYTLDGYNHIGGMGVPMPLTTYKLRDIETNELIESDKYPLVGEGLISTPNLTSGILDGKVVVPTIEIDGKKYLPTKDIIQVNEDGSLLFIDRKDRMFTRYDAYNVYPSNIENMLKSLPEIHDCVITSYWDEEKNSNMPIAYYKIKEDYESFDEKEFITNTINTKFLSGNNNIEDDKVYKANFRDIPTKWLRVDSIPKNTMGKNDYNFFKKRQLDGSEYDVSITMDNLNVYAFEVVEPKTNEKKLIKKV